ncbi:S8 family serine peptidase [Ferdinandcohnia sp. SAFN-114]|uniref:S8 family serine peptidase n=1 Tax=Ferdinandcohnia sp. SAFN-114 TaxID=3387275 RepID=UPI003F821343
MSKNRKFNKLFTSLLIFVLVFSFFAPGLVSAESTSTKDINLDERRSAIKQVIEAQEALVSEKPTIHPSLVNLNGNKKVSVIVQLSENPVALEKGKKELKGQTFSASQEAAAEKKVVEQQASFDKKLKEARIDGKKGYSYQKVFNGVSLTLPAKDIQKLVNIKGVVRVEPDSERYALQDITPVDDDVSATMNTSNSYLDVPAIWDMGYEGENVKVAVLDTGIDYNHPEFEGVYKGGYNFVLHGNDYTRGRADNDPYETTPEDRPDHKPEVNSTGHTFYTDHGTHVAGTIAAIGANPYGIKGIAPKVDLYAYRVLGAYGSGATSGIIAGIEKAVEEGMDIINLSLGGGSNSETAPDSIAINNAVLKGVTAVVATGNSGPGRSSIGNPSTASLAISVGNSTLPSETIQSTITVKAGDFEDEYNVGLMGWTFASDPEETLSGTFDVVAVPGLGAPADYNGLDVKGKIALVSRGDIAFVDKIAAAKEAGALGIIIHNNVPDAGPAGFLLGDSFKFIPTYDIPTAKGKEFRDAIAATDNKLGQVTFSNYVKGTVAGDDINDSSSRGPSTPNFDIKPDVSAPGTNIMSSVPAYGKDYPDADYSESYDRFTGTSMATPHVAGIAALLLSKNPNWEPSDIKVALSNTAKQLDKKLYDVFAQGAGRVQPLEAINAEALAYALDTTEFEGQTHNHKKGTVTFGKVVPNPEKETVITKEIEVKDLVSKTKNFDVSVEVTKAATGALEDAEVTVNKSSFTLNGKETLTVALTVPAGEDSPGNELLGYIHIVSEGTKLALPFAVAFSDEGPSGLEYYFLNEYGISPNGDGKHEEASLELGLLGDEDLVTIELWDAVNPEGGAFGDGYLGFMYLDSLSAGYYTLNGIDGTYFEWPTGEPAVAPEGVYTVDMLSWNAETFEPETLLGDDGPLFIKTSSPEISFDTVEGEIEGSEITVKGLITDKFIDFKSTVEGLFGIPYDVNEQLDVSYVATNKDGSTIGQDSITIEQDGSFEIPLTGLQAGENTLTLAVEDSVANSATQEVKLPVKEAEKPKEFAVSLTPSTTEETEGPVTVSVETDSEEELVALKWLKGEKTAADFVEGGIDISLEEKKFDVVENGTYTVYAKNSVGVEAIQTITVENIVVPPAPIAIELTPSTTEPTEGPITVTVTTDSEEELEVVKWLEGQKEVSDFAEAGNEVNLETLAFDVSANGTYTVYAKNTAGVEAVQTIVVDNIVEPVKPISIELTPSTTEPTGGPVSITIATDSESDLVAMKWLQGEKTATDFDNAGADIDPETKTFDVIVNDTYTVYVKNLEGAEALKTIKVENIVEPTEPVTIELTPSTTEPTEGPVIIKVDVDGDVVAMKWLEGEKTVADFQDAGMDIDLEEKSFTVIKNGSYTVYVKNSDGTESVQVIKVNNIKPKVEPENPSPGDPDPQPNPDPQDPKPEDPKPQDPKPDNTGKQPNNSGKNGDNHNKGGKLPTTATSMFNYLLIGGALLLAGVIALFILNRRNKNVTL